MQNYRSFLGSKGNSALGYFAKFNYWYSGYLMQALAKENYNVKPFKAEILTKFYSYMDSNLMEIINNEGFKAVTDAIANSTVRLQYARDNAKYKIRYGFAQQLQNKAKSKETLATFIGDFLGTYDAETALKYEKDHTTYGRRRITEKQKEEFFRLLETNSSQLMGALLASFGFAKKSAETDQSKLTKLQDDAAELGYQLVKADTEISALSDQNNNIENEY